MGDRHRRRYGFGYRLLAVVVFASVLAMGFQVLVAQLALATGEDLASLTRRHLPTPLAKAAWLAGEAAILATALAELVGGGIALKLLLGLPCPSRWCRSPGWRAAAR